MASRTLNFPAPATAASQPASSIVTPPISPAAKSRATILPIRAHRFRGLHLVGSEPSATPLRITEIPQRNSLSHAHAIVAQVEREVAQKARRGRLHFAPPPALAKPVHQTRIVRDNPLVVTRRVVRMLFALTRFA